MRFLSENKKHQFDGILRLLLGTFKSRNYQNNEKIIHNYQDMTFHLIDSQRFLERSSSSYSPVLSPLLDIGLYWVIFWAVLIQCWWSTPASFVRSKSSVNCYMVHLSSLNLATCLSHFHFKVVIRRIMFCPSCPLSNFLFVFPILGRDISNFL